MDLSVRDEFQGGSVIAVHTQENTNGVAGVVLTFSMEDRYNVWLVDQQGVVVDSDQYGDCPAALFRYAERVTDQIYRYHNRTAPGLSFEVKNNG